MDKMSELLPDISGFDPSPHDIRNRAISHLLQVIKNDPEYPQYPPHCQEDYVWDRLNNLEDDDHLPMHLSAFDIFTQFIRVHRPETTVLKVKQQPPRGAFYE